MAIVPVEFKLCMKDSGNDAGNYTIDKFLPAARPFDRGLSKSVS